MSTSATPRPEHTFGATCVQLTEPVGLEDDVATIAMARQLLHIKLGSNRNARRRVLEWLLARELEDGP